MTDDNTKALLDGLMARRGNSPEFILELEGYSDDLAHDELDKSDIKYIRDLAKRLGAGDGGDGGDAPVEPDEIIEDDTDEVDGDDDDGASQFDRAKAAFNERFNPDSLDPDAPDSAIRREVYEEFSAVLDRIEDEG